MVFVRHFRFPVQEFLEALGLPREFWNVSSSESGEHKTGFRRIARHTSLSKRFPDLHGSS